jgi:hypothetical protein
MFNIAQCKLYEAPRAECGNQLEYNGARHCMCINMVPIHGFQVHASGHIHSLLFLSPPVYTRVSTPHTFNLMM